MAQAHFSSFSKTEHIPDTILEVILNGEIIEDYSQDKPFPSCLIFKIVNGKPYHIVVSYDSEYKKHI
jgi:hypothetical protein